MLESTISTVGHAEFMVVNRIISGIFLDEFSLAIGNSLALHNGTSPAAPRTDEGVYEFLLTSSLNQ